MRFSTLVAFILPLSALAAPSLVKRDAADDDDPYRQQRTDLANALGAANIALEWIVTYSKGASQPQIQEVIRKAKKAQGHIVTAIKVEESIVALVKAKQAVKLDDHAMVTKNLFMANHAITAFKEEFKIGKTHYRRFAKLLDIADKQVVSAMVSDLKLLNIQGMTLNGLLGDWKPGSKQ